MNALLFLAARRCGIALPWSLSIGCRVWFCRTIETSVFVPHLVVELLFAVRLEGGVTVQVELCRFGGGATPLSGFSGRCHCIGAPVQAWDGGTALGRDMSLSLGSAVTYCLLLLRRC